MEKEQIKNTEKWGVCFNNFLIDCQSRTDGLKGFLPEKFGPKELAVLSFLLMGGAEIAIAPKVQAEQQFEMAKLIGLAEKLEAGEITLEDLLAQDREGLDKSLAEIGGEIGKLESEAERIKQWLIDLFKSGGEDKIKVILDGVRDFLSATSVKQDGKEGKENLVRYVEEVAAMIGGTTTITENMPEEDRESSYTVSSPSFSYDFKGFYIQYIDTIIRNNLDLLKLEALNPGDPGGLREIYDVYYKRVIEDVVPMVFRAIYAGNGEATDRENDELFAFIDSRSAGRFQDFKELMADRGLEEDVLKLEMLKIVQEFIELKKEGIDVDKQLDKEAENWNYSAAQLNGLLSGLGDSDARVRKMYESEAPGFIRSEIVDMLVDADLMDLSEDEKELLKIWTATIGGSEDADLRATDGKLVIYTENIDPGMAGDDIETKVIINVNPHNSEAGEDIFDVEDTNDYFTRAGKKVSEEVRYFQLMKNALSNLKKAILESEDFKLPLGFKDKKEFSQKSNSLFSKIFGFLREKAGLLQILKEKMDRLVNIQQELSTEK